MSRYVYHSTAKPFLRSLKPESVHLVAIDPPYYEIVNDGWDNQWRSSSDYVDWVCDHIDTALPAMAPTSSLVIFQAIGKHGNAPVLDVRRKLEELLFYRNWITWKKRRAYGKSHDYLFCREEILWFSKSEGRTDVTFNIPLLDVKRGYDGFNPKYKAKSEYKRVSNVWDDIPELMRPQRNCQKPIPLMERLIRTHSNKGDLVVDFFAGWGSTGIAALGLGRRFVGCEAIGPDADAANARCEATELKDEAPQDVAAVSDEETDDGFLVVE
ncbi:MAG TPA: site-specific DNA-methyltransferase [Gammaproteobacteria bacterium]|jgi:DNA modification methylase|nr:site-specific DNA-methyltransferase [Gammaproteobacteria bacterium]